MEPRFTRFFADEGPADGILGGTCCKIFRDRIQSNDERGVQVRMLIQAVCAGDHDGEHNLSVELESADFTAFLNHSPDGWGFQSAAATQGHC